jgi:hypothetical protein
LSFYGSKKFVKAVNLEENGIEGEGKTAEKAWKRDLGLGVGKQMKRI